MRCLLLLCLGPLLLAAPPKDLPQPGLDKVFLERVLPEVSEGQGRPWHLYREPTTSASAVVEVVGELTAEERRQATFQAFLVWFREDLHQFAKRCLGAEGAPAVAADLPNRGPGPMLVPLGRAQL